MNTPTSNVSAHKAGRGQLLAIVLIVLLGAVAGALILRPGLAQPKGSQVQAEAGHKAGKEDADEHGDEHGHEKKDVDADSHTEQQLAKGPHGGRQFSDETIGLELLLSEAGGEPRFKAWVTDKNQAVGAGTATVSVLLTRPGGQQETITFEAVKDGLQSKQTIDEPHVFDAQVTLAAAGGQHQFAFSLHEGKVAMSDAQVAAAGVAIETAAAASIRSSLQLPGEIRLNEDRTAHIVPRVAGVVENVSADLGQPVKKGQVLAVLSSVTLSEQRSELQAARKRLELARTTYAREKKLWEEKISPQQDVQQAQQAMREAEIAVANANQKLAALGASASASGSALSRYELRAPFDGMVVEKHIALGESVKEDTNVFKISDLSTVWAEMNISARDLPRVRVGGKVQVRATAFDAKAVGTVSYVGSLIGEQTRTARARVTLPNPDLAWRPGLFVNVEVVSDESTVPVAIASEALQTVEDRPVVFLRVPGGFVPQPVQVGRSDGKRVEITSGLKAGAPYAAAGSFVVKAEQGKGTASHTH